MKGLNPNAHHQLVTSPAASGGLLPLPVNGSEDFPSWLQQLCRAHTAVLPKVGLSNSDGADGSMQTLVTLLSVMLKYPPLPEPLAATN
ncbi:MAG: hypothetical protein ICV84_09065 [Flavisolibacter sp.]|nr:hypothetical protein [Flavisolibacter sp.]